MKKIFFLLMTLGWLTTLNAQWIEQNSGTTENLNDVFCITADTVVVVGDNGTILRTTNGGTQWNTITSPTTEHLNRVAFADAQTGYIVGKHSTLLKSTDAGQTWQSLNTGTTISLTAISCVTADTVYIGGYGELILKTTDGGLTWNTEHTGGWRRISDIQMINGTLGYAVSDTPNGKIYKKINTNNQWNELSNVSSGYVAIYMLNAQEGFIMNERQLFKTNDGANNFISIMIEYDINNPQEIYASDMNHIWVVGTNTFANNTSAPGLVAKYTLNNDPNTGYIEQKVIADSGINYNPISSIAFYNNVGYIVGYGTIYKNTTGQNYFPGGGDVAEISKEIFSISPNPAQNQVFINLKDDSNPYPAQYRITDLQGKALTPFTALQTGKPIDVSRLTNGIYLIQVQTQGQVYTQKLLIQK